MEKFLDPRALLRICWRRKWLIIVPGTVVVAAALAVAFLSPPIYRSEATIIIETQDVPEDLVPSLNSDYVERRFDSLTRQILLTDNLLRLINRYDLYAAERDELSPTLLAERMRDDIVTTIVSTEVNDPNSGVSREITVAFEVSFDYRDPEKARRVNDELVSSYLAAHIEDRRDVASQATTFFENERQDVEERIAALDQEFSAFKTANQEYLPTEIAFSRQLLANVEQQLQLLDRDIRSLREREGFLTTELALTEEFDTPSLGGRELTPEARLELALSDLATARARYTATHPDVVRAEREVRSLQSMVGQRGGGLGLAERESALVGELAALRERYTGDHPDVLAAERQLSSLREAIAASRSQDGSTSGRATPRNPAYVQLRAQLNSVRSERAAIEQQYAKLLDDRLRLQETLSRAPSVENEYMRLERELANAIADRDVLADKEATAQLSSALEAEAIGERLVLAEPASTPLSPVSPNKKLILALGLVLAAGSSSAAVALAELLDRSVRSASDLARLLGDTPLVSIPSILSPADRQRSWVMRLIVVVVAIGVGVGALALVNTRLVPLDVLGYQAMNSVEAWVTEKFPTARSSSDGVP